MILIRKLGIYFIPYIYHVIFSMLCMAVVGATAGVTAWLVKPVLDDIFIRHDAWMLKVIPLGLLGLYLLKGTCRYIQAYIMRWVGEKVVLQMREDFMRSLQSRDIAFFDKHSTGELMAMVTSDVGNMYRAIPETIKIIRTLFTVLGLIVVLFVRDWKLALLAMVVFPLAAYPLRRIGILLRAYSGRTQEEIGGMSGILQEAFSGIAVVKSFRTESREVARFRAAADRLLRLGMKRARLDEATAPFMEFLGAIGASLIIWYGGNQVLEGGSTPGEFFSFLTALFMLYDPVKMVGMLGNNIQTALASGERVFEMMDLPSAACEQGGSITLKPPISKITMEDVCFHYDVQKGYVLQGVSLEAMCGQMVALVGPSGGGKSTILKLLPRFYDPSSGTILINGVDIKEYTLESLRDSISVVGQDTFLFNDSILSNILVGNPGACRDEALSAARAAHAHEFIVGLPQGYDTVVGERGDLLSGGQRQRIAIARALLKDAPILLLDEATSALDTASEKAVQEALDTLMVGRTTFVVAHRLSTVRNADCIYVIQNGCVVESGDHNTLLDLDGEYARFCQLQFASEDAPQLGRALS